MPSSNFLTFSDPLPYQAALWISDIEIVPTDKGKFHAELTQINLDKIWMQRGHENLPQVVAGKVTPIRKAITFLTKEQDMIYCGQSVLPGSIIVHRTDSQHRRNAANRNWGSMSLAHDDFHAACKVITGCDIQDESLALVVRPDPDLTSRLLHVHATVEMIAKTSPGIFVMPEVVRSLEQQLIHLMIRCLADSVSLSMSAGSWRHDRIIARFEEFLEANSDQPVYLAEICAALGVAERTLRAACEEHLGMGPIRYLTLRRMHLVRRALLRADPLKATVTQIATDYGFWELGRFSVAYRVLFGELPSESLRMPAVERSRLVDRPSSLADFVDRH
ncbi:helix-turn-helix domain-containing protein [Bradyrhizobium sp. LA7.1]|uniref:AraC family transcriptional regulator n=1 Tax=unclassified Bradyrhizobium TaxID=2631580 RepID=UPI00339A1B27